MKISVIIIFDVFRKEKLTRLLNSMKEQLDNFSYTDNDKGANEVEVILIHESDESLPTPKLPVEVNYFTIPAKQGIAFNRNQGIKHSQGEIIVFIDDDCWVNDNWLKSLVKPLEKDENTLVSTSGTKIPKSNLVGDCISALGFPGGGSLGFDKVWKISKDGFTNHLAAGNCAIRKGVFDKIGQFDETMKFGAEDAELSYRLEKNNISVKYVPEAYAFHEARDTLASFIKWQLRRGKANYHFKNKVGPVGDFVRLRIWSAKNILRENKYNLRLPLIFFFLGSSFILQQTGYLLEKRRVRE